MSSRDISTWMWSEALSMLERADRLQRQFSPLVADSAPRSFPSWEPPVDVVEEASGTIRVHVALPGAERDSITIGVDAGGITVSALRAFPCRGDDAHIHRVEIPYGRFERRLSLPMEGIDLEARAFEDGVLTLLFRRKEGA